MIKRYNSSELLSLDVSDGKINFIGDEGSLLISITDTEIFGRAQKE